jgi:hypothetical protein
MNRLYTFIKYGCVLLSFVFFGALPAHADDSTISGSSSTSQQEATATYRIPKTTATLTDYYYSFVGTRDADSGIYGFGNIALHMQMMSLQYNLTPTWTLMAIANHQENSVVTKFMGTNYTDGTQGFGDTSLLAVHPLLAAGTYFLSTDFGVSVPTGSINFRSKEVPSLNYPYNMQMGSGTVDGLVALTQLWLPGPVQVGSRASADVRTGQNSNGYRLGNQYRVDAWTDYPWKYGITPRIVGYYRYKEGVVGQDSALGPVARSPLLQYYYNPQIDWNVSLAVKAQQPITKALSVGGEVGVPVAQGCLNSDLVVVSTRYYGSLFLSGTF